MTYGLPRSNRARGERRSADGDRGLFGRFARSFLKCLTRARKSVRKCAWILFDAFLS